MGAMASQITSLAIVYSNVHSGADQRKHQSSTPLAFVWGIHRWPVNSPHKWPVTRKMFPFVDVFMLWLYNPNTTKHNRGMCIIHGIYCTLLQWPIRRTNFESKKLWKPRDVIMLTLSYLLAQHFAINTICGRHYGNYLFNEKHPYLTTTDEICGAFWD